VYHHETSGPESGVSGTGQTTFVPSALHRPKHQNADDMWLSECWKIQLYQQGNENKNKKNNFIVG